MPAHTVGAPIITCKGKFRSLVTESVTKQNPTLTSSQLSESSSALAQCNGDNSSCSGRIARTVTCSSPFEPHQALVQMPDSHIYNIAQTGSAEDKRVG